MSMLNMQSLKVPLVLTVAYFFVYPMLNSVLLPSLGFLGATVGQGAIFAVFVFIGLWATSKFVGGSPVKPKLVPIAIVTALYIFAFGMMNSFLSPVLGFMGTATQYLIVFAFFWLSIEIVKLFGKKV